MSMNIKTIHSDKIGNQIEFDLERDESDGTKSYLNLQDLL